MATKVDFKLTTKGLTQKGEAYQEGHFLLINTEEFGWLVFHEATKKMTMGRKAGFVKKRYAMEFVAVLEASGFKWDFKSDKEYRARITDGGIFLAGVVNKAYDAVELLIKSGK